MNVTYSDDKKFLIISPLFSGLSEVKKVPVAFVDELLERGLSRNDLEKLASYREVTRGHDFTISTIKELAGQNLSEYTVLIQANLYGDDPYSWTYAGEIVSVKRLEDAEGRYMSAYPLEDAEGRYLFTYSEEQTKWFNGEYDEDEELQEDLHLEELIGVTFWGNTEVIVYKREEVQNEL